MEPNGKEPKRTNRPVGRPRLDPDPEDIGRVRKKVAVFLVEDDAAALFSLDIAETPSLI